MLGEFYNLRMQNVNKEMLKHGMVVMYKFSLKEPACKDYIKIEETAKLYERNVWSDPKFVTPLEYRIG